MMSPPQVGGKVSVKLGSKFMAAEIVAASDFFSTAELRAVCK